MRAGPAEGAEFVLDAVGGKGFLVSFFALGCFVVGFTEIGLNGAYSFGYSGPCGSAAPFGPSYCGFRVLITKLPFSLIPSSA